MSAKTHQSWLVHTPLTWTEREAVADCLFQADITPTEEIWTNQPDESLSIEMVRNLMSQLAYSSAEGQLRCLVICNIETASIPAQNALLKTLEEPPAHTLIILTTRNAQRILPTIRSRCLDKQVSNTGDEKQMQAPDWSQLAALYQEIGQAGYDRHIQLAEKYTDRTTALELITQLIVYLHSTYLTPETQEKNQPVVVKQLGILLTASDQLQHNCNVRLAVENCFFSLKDAEQ